MVRAYTAFFAIVCSSLTSCGTNFFGFLVVTKDSSEVMVLEQVRNDLDGQKYRSAIDRLEGLEESSNERSLLLASAYIGNSGLDLWSLIRQVVEDGSNSGGIDQFFDSVSQGFFGEGSEKDQKRTGMRQAIVALVDAPDRSDKRVANLGCFLAGLWSYPTLTEASAAMSNLQSSLASISLNIATTGDCGSTETLEEEVAKVETVASDMKLIGQMIAGCSIFSPDGASASLNSIERSLNKFMTRADVGCSTSACTGPAAVCSALEAGCVQSSFSSVSREGDDEIAACEILYGCADTSLCF